MILFSDKLLNRSVLLVAALSLFWAGCDDGSESDSQNLDSLLEGVVGSDLVVAEIDGDPITAADLVSKVRIQFPKMPQEGPGLADQCKEIVKRVVEEECFTKYGAERGFDKDPEFLRKMELSRSYILTTTTYNKTVGARATPSEEEQRAAYDEATDKFQIKPKTWYFHILVDSEAKAWGLHKQLVSGADFETLAKESSIDEATAPKGGRMPPMDSTYRCGHIGTQVEFGRRVLEMAKDEISEPIQTEHGWHLVKIEAVRSFRKLPFEEVQEAIVKKLRSSTEAQIYRAFYDSLKKAYNVKVDDDALNEFFFLQMNDEELFDIAQRTDVARKKRDAYKHLIKRFPDSEYVPESLFMVGFISIEDLSDTLMARESFSSFLETYPEHEMAGSARLMYAEIKED